MVGSGVHEGSQSVRSIEFLYGSGNVADLLPSSLLSACVYPVRLQEMGAKPLREDDTLSVGDGWRSSDNTYGWAKLMAELELKAYYEQYGFKSSTCRYPTVYEPEEYDESHAIASLVREALRREDPYVVWGSGSRREASNTLAILVDGTILAAEKIQDATPVNLGWSEKHKIKHVATTILELTGHSPKKVGGYYRRSLQRNV